jgi:triosephosphate isomerase
MTRTFFVGGNWKMNGSCSQANSLVEMLNNAAIPSDVGEFLPAFSFQKSVLCKATGSKDQIVLFLVIDG